MTDPAFNTKVIAVNDSNGLPVQVIADPLSAKDRMEQAAYKTVCQFVLSMEGNSQEAKIKQFSDVFAANQLPSEVFKSLSIVRGKKMHICPNRATIHRWFKRLEKFKNGDPKALSKGYKGRQRQLYGWEHKAIELFNQPSKPGYADVAYWLRTDHGFESATKSRVTRYLKSMPETLGKKSPDRMGKTFYQHNLKPHKMRDNEVLPVGYGYEGDGHTVDVYVAHPATGNLYRPELTVWIDVHSRMIVGWYLSDSESAISTLFAISHALLSQDHVPAVLFLDNGSGFKARMMNDDVSGFFSRLSITPNWALPGNSKGKGLVEGFFKIYRNRLDKKYQTYCGDDMAPEINRRLPEMVKRGLRTLPSFADYKADIARFIEHYNDEPKPVLNGKSPRQVWEAGLKRVPIHIKADALVQPRELRTVRKWRVQLHKRTYQAAELAHYNGREVLVEYSLHQDDEVRILDDQERLICIARLVGKVARLPESRIEEAEQKRLDGQIKRLEAHAHEKRLRSQPALSHEDSADVLDGLLADEAPKALEYDDFDPMDSLYLGGPDNHLELHVVCWLDQE